MTEFLLWIAFVVLTLKVIKLSGRVRDLELARETVAPLPSVALPPVVSPPVAPEVTEPEPYFEPVAVEPGPVEPALAPSAAAFDEPAPEVTKPARVDWETLLGGNLLNKAGVLLLMVGMALLIGYSMRTMGPAGRIALGALVSGAMLAGGIFADKREAYSTFGHGLIGGGWAGLY